MNVTALEQEQIDHLLERRPDLRACVEPLLQIHEALVECYDTDGKLLTCGNGGSNADAMHIVGELCKSFERKRPVPEAFAEALHPLPYGRELAANLEVGLAAVALGYNGALKTAVENDNALRDIAFAQEAFALVKPGDVLLALSTSGNAANCLMAMSVAKAVGATTVSFTGPSGGKMAEAADIALQAPGDSTKVVQEAHIALYHTMCLLIETHYFTEKR